MPPPRRYKLKDGLVTHPKQHYSYVEDLVHRAEWKYDAQIFSLSMCHSQPTSFYSTQDLSSREVEFLMLLSAKL